MKIPQPSHERSIEIDISEEFYKVYFRGRSRVYAKDKVFDDTHAGKLLPCGWYMSQHRATIDWDANVIAFRHPYDTGKGPCGIELPMKLRTFLERIQAYRAEWMKARFEKYDEARGSYGEGDGWLTE